MGASLKQEEQFRQECFLQFKALYPDLLDCFTETSSEFIPMTGCALVPGTTPQTGPDFPAVKEQIENASKSGETVDVKRWMPDHLHWFLAKKPEQQRDKFFGFGGMLTLYLPPDPSTEPPLLSLPKVVTTHPGYSDSMLSDIQAMYSLQDDFLAKSKTLFGEPFRRSPTYKGLLFVLPLLTGASIMQSTADQREKWFSVFSGYFIENKEERGMMLALKNPDFDLKLAYLVEEMEKEGLVYRN